MDSKVSGTITKKGIKKILIQHYFVTHSGSKINRALFTCTPKQHGDGETYLLVLQGSPPKGYGLYIKDIKRLWLFDATGKRFKDYFLAKGISDLDD